MSKAQSLITIRTITVRRRGTRRFWILRDRRPYVVMERLERPYQPIIVWTQGEFRERKRAEDFARAVARSKSAIVQFYDDHGLATYRRDFGR